MKLGKLKRIFISALLLVVMLFSSACFADMDPNDKNVSFIGEIQGFKTNYRPNVFNYTDFYYDFAEDVLLSLYETFSYDADISPLLDDIYASNVQQPVEQIDKNSNEYKEFIMPFFSDIQYSTIILKNQQGQFIDPNGEICSEPYYFKEDISWKWDLEDLSHRHYFTENQQPVSSIDVILSYYSMLHNQDSTKQDLTIRVQQKAKLLQANILEIILGKTPTIWSSSNSGNIDTILGNAVMIGGNVIATGLMGELTTKGSYVGISAEALAVIKEYILEEVIGSQKFFENNPKNNFTKDDYGLILDTIWKNKDDFKLHNIFDESLENQNGSVFDIYPATYIKDYLTNAFFINSEDDVAFEHIEKAEYQSVIIMPSKVQLLSEIWLFLASDRQMTVNYYTRVYNKDTNTMYVGAVNSTVTNIESEFVFEDANVCELGFYDNGKETLALLAEFNQDIGGGILKTDGLAIPMNYSRSKYYDAEPSQNGFGTISVANPSTFAGDDGCSFVEIVFDVEKDPNAPNLDYSFKIGMFYFGLATKSQINDYLKNQ